jgi:hypothetical protein
MDEQLPDGTAAINLRTATKLSKEEAIYALDTLFRGKGVKVVLDGQHLMKVVPVVAKE